MICIQTARSDTRIDLAASKVAKMQSYELFGADIVDESQYADKDDEEG
jgi:hypothetical protein